jgi:hypothetical protein
MIVLAACKGSVEDSGSANEPPSGEARDGAAAASSCAEPDCSHACVASLPVYEDGKVARSVCADRAKDEGLTVVDLADDWAPRVLAGSPELGPVPYRASYVELANERFGDDPVSDRARTDRYLELFGIFPSFAVIKSRLVDDERHACHDAVPHDGLTTLDHGVNTWQPVAEQQAEHGTIPVLEQRLAAYAAQRGVPLHQLDDERGYYGAIYDRYKAIKTQRAAVREMQAHLACEGLYEGEPNGLVDSQTINGMEAYHRRHMIVSWQLDDETRQTLMSDSRELDFKTLLRALRERVVDATGLIEDGSASGEHALVAGRQIDAAAFLDESRGEHLASGAPDLIGAATDAAARALGWTGPGEARTFFAAETPKQVALKLPPVPAYHGEHMELSAMIDRGDIWYEFPFGSGGDRFQHPRAQKPSMVLYTMLDGEPLPLVRWPTTIGNWQPENINGRVMLLYKESPPGPRVWRDVVAEPRWVPPASTPNRDLMRPRKDGRWVPKLDTFGPHYASAYGIAMLIHHRVDQAPGEEPIFTDQAVRTHGSVSYASILEGFSHGCHRLHNHRAVRLTGFLLAHRHHEVRGPIPLDFHRSIYFKGKRTQLDFESRGFRYELTPPVEVEVLKGRVMGRAKGPLPPRNLPGKLGLRYSF